MVRLMNVCATVVCLTACALAAPAPKGPPAARLVVELPDTNHSVFSDPALSPDGRWLAVDHVNDDADYPALLFDLSRERPRADHLVVPSSRSWRDPHFSPDGSCLMTTGRQERGKPDAVRVWDVATRKVARVVPAPEGMDLSTACYLADDSRMAVGYRSGEVEVWTVTGDKVERTPIHKHADWVHKVRATPCGRWLLSADFNSVVVFDAKTFKEVRRWTAPKRGGYKFGLSPDGTRFVIRPLREARYEVWDVATGKKICEMHGPKRCKLSTQIASAFSPDGRFLATACALIKDEGDPPSHGLVSVWDAATGDLILEFKADGHWTEGVVFGKSAATLVTLGYATADDVYDPGRFKVWQLSGLPPKP